MDLLLIIVLKVVYHFVTQFRYFWEAEVKDESYFLLNIAIPNVIIFSLKTFFLIGY